MPPKEINIPPELTQAIKTDKLIIFVGAGLSWDLKNQQGEKLEGWDNLVLKILENLKGKEFDVDHFIGLVKKCEPIKILDLIEDDKNFNKNDIAHFIKDFVDLSEENDLSLHKKLFQLSNKIITTNYDTAFEIKIKELRKSTAYKGRNYELTLHKDPKKPLLFKLHGCYEAVDSMVLFPTDYNALYNKPTTDAEHSLSVLKNIIYNKSVLFVGCGMGDFQINNFFKKIKELQGDYNQKHFIIDTKPLDSSLDFLLRIPIGDYSEIPLVIERLLEEKEKFKQEKTHREQEMERQLIDAKEKLAKFEEDLQYITDGVERMKKLLEREAWKYFERGLEFSLNEKWEKAIKEYKTAIELNSDFVWALTNLGSALGVLATIKVGVEANLLYDRAVEKYRRVTEINPNFPEVFYCWGFLCRELASKKSGEEAEGLYYQAIEKYKKAIEIKTNYSDAINNFGGVLHSLAIKKTGQERETLCYQAIEKFRRAIEIKPNFYMAHKNWGTVLGTLAKTKPVAEAESLYYQAFEKFQKATEIKPNYHEAYYNWGSDLLDIAKIKSNSEFKTLLQHASEKLTIAFELGGNCYNLACVYALQSDKENALSHLEQSLNNMEVVTDYPTKDQDFKTYWQDKDFQKLIKKYEPK